MYKHSSLFYPSIIEEEKHFITLAPELTNLLFYHYIDGGANQSKSYSKEELVKLQTVGQF